MAKLPMSIGLEVVERLDIKIVFEQVEKYRKPGTLIKYGIPIYE
jgi:acyl carrier protein